jgi:hypothetical protein
MGLEDIDEDVPYTAPSTGGEPATKTIDDLFGNIPMSAPAAVPSPQKPLDDFDMFFASAPTNNASQQQRTSSPQAQRVVQQDLLSFSPTTTGASPRRAKTPVGEEDFLRDFVASAKGVRPQGSAPAPTTLESLRQQYGSQSLDTSKLGANFLQLLTPYEVLGVSPAATIEEIRTIYKKKALAMHPDKHTNLTAEQQGLFKKITDAYELLSDEDTRRAYDMQHGVRKMAPGPTPVPPL